MRKFILFLTLALLVTAFAVPAFATENDNIVCEIPYMSGSGSVETLVPPGTYGVKVFVGDIVVMTDTVIFTEYPHYYIKEFDYDGITWVAEITFTSSGADCFIGGLEFEMFGYDGEVVVYTPAPEPDPISVTDAFGIVFSDMGAWLVSAFASLVAIFWTGSSLTLVGVLSVCALAVAIVLYVIYCIKSAW